MANAGFRWNLLYTCQLREIAPKIGDQVKLKRMQDSKKSVSIVREPSQTTAPVPVPVSVVYYGLIL